MPNVIPAQSRASVQTAARRSIQMSDVINRPLKASRVWRPHFEVAGLKRRMALERDINRFQPNHNCFSLTNASVLCASIANT